MKPVIGLIPLIDEERESYWMLPGYMTGISMAGGIPVMLPLEMDDNDIRQAAVSLDGFLFTGGHDVSPSLYNEKKLPECGSVCLERDHLEQRLFVCARKMDKPVLGICRGIQRGSPPLIFRLARRKTSIIRFFRGRVPRKKLFSACKCASDVKRSSRRSVSTLGRKLHSSPSVFLLTAKQLLCS